MIRVLAMIAVAGFLVSVATLSAAVGLAGPQAVLNGAWTFGPHGWGGHWSGHNHFSWSDDGGRTDAGTDDGPQASRDIPWTGGAVLDVELPADIRYTQGAGPAKITVSGPQDAVADVEMADGRIRYRNDHDDDARLTVVITAPSVTRFVMESSGKLDIAAYRQDKLDLDLQGDADVTAAGEAKAVQLAISGSANADLRAVKAQQAKVEIEGSGDATLAPTDAADVNISGSGDVTLLTHPPRLQTEISGSGRVKQDTSAQAPAGAPPSKTGRG